MSGETTNVQTEDGQLLAAEYKDGRLQIVEVSSYEKNHESNIVPDSASDDGDSQYIQVLDSSGKGLVQLDLLNFTLVKCQDGASSSLQAAGDEDASFTCVFNDGNNVQGSESYVLMESLPENDQEINTPKDDNSPKTPLTPIEILERAKTLQIFKELTQAELTPRNTRGRKRKGGLPAPLELLSSPNFKLYLYSCKMCCFKCNAIKEMSAHKAAEHSASASRGTGVRNANLQCARCPYRAPTQSQLGIHVQEVHFPETVEDNMEDKSSEHEEVCQELLVCGACGFESGDRSTFRDHLQRDHGYNVTLDDSILSTKEVTENKNES